MSFVEQILYSVDPVQSRLSTLCARKQAKRDHLHQSGEAVLRPTPTSFITSLITQVAIFRNWFLGIAVTLASYCLGNKCSDNRFVFDCAKKSKKHSLISEQFLVLIGIGLVTSLIADFVLENGESSCGDASEEKKFFSVVSCWTLFLCQFFHSLVLMSHLMQSRQVPNNNLSGFTDKR